MNRNGRSLSLLLSLLLVAAFCAPALEAQEAAGLTADQAIERYLEARGGSERWKQVDTLTLRGTYAAFSEESPFTLVRARGDRFRLEHTLLDTPTIRARDAEGPWMQHPFLTPLPQRATQGPYKVQIERESLFPLLLDGWKEKGLTVELAGEQEVDGIPTLALTVTFPDEQVETWHLDPDSYLELAVDAEVNDMTQGPQRMLQRTYFDDFREVEGLMIPHRVELEFGARLEVMSVDSVEVGGEVAADAFSPPPPAEDTSTES